MNPQRRRNGASPGPAADIATTNKQHSQSTAKDDVSALLMLDLVLPVQRESSEPKLASGEGESPWPPTIGSERAAWISVALGGVRKLAASGERFQAHDLVLRCAVPEPPDHHMWGSLMSRAHAEGIVVAIAATPSSRPRTAHSLTKLWVGSAHVKDAEAA